MRHLAHSPRRIAGVIALVVFLSGGAFAQGDDGVAAAKDGVAAAKDGVAAAKDGVAAAKGRGVGFPPGLAEARLIKERPEQIGVGKETLEKLEKLVAEVKEKEAELQRETVEARSVVTGLLEKPRPDEKELMAAVGATSALAREGRELKIETSLRIRALLNDEQLEKLMEFRRKAMERRRKGGRPNVRR